MITLPKTQGGWQTILLDPPWTYHNMGDKLRGNPSFHYKTASDQLIMNLPVNEVLADNATVWLWTTNAHLHTALHCLERWKVNYKTMLTWVKTSFGVGFWLRGQTEHLLLAARGTPPRSLDLDSEGFGTNASTAFLASVEEHSKKPDGIYPLIERLTLVPRLEVFARSQREGWFSFGDEVNTQLQKVLGETTPTVST